MGVKGEHMGRNEVVLQRCMCSDKEDEWGGGEGGGGLGQYRAGGWKREGVWAGRGGGETERKRVMRMWPLRL